jgi:hypothetical protein
MWQVDYDDAFAAEVRRLSVAVREELLAHVKLLEQFGPTLGRPRADTLAGSRHSNMKELRFDAAGGVWRVAFAFDPVRRAILLVGGDKRGVSQRRFYKTLLATADARFDAHLAAIGKRRKGK